MRGIRTGRDREGGLGTKDERDWLGTKDEGGGRLGEGGDEEGWGMEGG